MSLKWLPILIATALLAIACGGEGSLTATSSPSADVRVAVDGALRIDPDPATVAPSGDVTISLVMEAPVAGLGAWTIDMSFDQEVVGDADRCTAVPGSGSLCDPSFVLADGRTVVRVRGESLRDPGGLHGTGPLADIIFENVPGRLGESTQLTITVVAFADSNDRTVRPTADHGEIRIEAPTPTPTPQPPFTIPPGAIPTGAILLTGGEFGREEPPGVFLVDGDGVRRIGDDLYYGVLDPQQVSISGRPILGRWSPDGASVAFWLCPELSLGEPPESSELYVIDSDGSRLTNVSSHPASDIVLCGTDAPFGGFDWSPDSSRLVFWSGRDPAGLYIVDTEGSGISYLAEGTLPSWSPSGDSIVFVSEPFDDVSEVAVYSIDADGSNRRLLATVPCGSYYGSQCRAPELRWSPDGSMLALTAVGEPPDFSELSPEANLNYDVFVLKADGTGVTNITNRPHDGTPGDGDYFANWVNCELSLPTAGCEVTVTNVQPQRLNLREDPGTDQEVIGKLSEGDTACLLGTPALKDDTQWWPLRTAEDQEEGWAAAFDPGESDKPWLTPSGRVCEGGDAAFRAFAAEIDHALQQRDLAFFRQRARTEHVLCTPENTPPRLPGGPNCQTVGQQFDGFRVGVWRSEGGIMPLDEALAHIERLWLEAIPGASDEFGVSAPRVYATGRQRSEDEAVHTAVLTALITRPANFEGSGPLRAVLVTSWVQEGSGWRFVRLIIAYRLGEEFLRPDPVIEGFVDNWQRFQPTN